MAYFKWESVCMYIHNTCMMQQSSCGSLEYELLICVHVCVLMYNRWAMWWNSNTLTQARWQKGWLAKWLTKAPTLLVSSQLSPSHPQCDSSSSSSYTQHLCCLGYLLFLLLRLHLPFSPSSFSVCFPFSCSSSGVSCILPVPNWVYIWNGSHLVCVSIVHRKER